MRHLVFVFEAQCYRELAVENRVDWVGGLRPHDQHLRVQQAFGAFGAVARPAVDRARCLVRSCIVVDSPFALGHQCSFRHCHFRMPNWERRGRGEVRREFGIFLIVQVVSAARYLSAVGACHLERALQVDRNPLVQIY